jgi:hypothetical protein
VTLAGYKNLSEFADILITRVLTKQDAVIVVDSLERKGLGKTSFSIDLMMEICRKRGIPFDIRKNIIYGATTKAVRDTIISEPECYPLSIDEALRVAFNRNYQDKKTEEADSIA